MHHSSVRSIETWAAHLRAVATDGAVAVPDLGLGDLELPFRAAVDGLVDTGARTVGGAETGDVHLWRARVDAAIDVDAMIAPIADGPLFEQDAYQALEVWTESELSGLHALSVVARLRESRSLAARVAACRAWHITNTQPDNATGRPWSLHVFVAAGTPESQHYAETLLHNALTGSLDTLSAWILVDCARELDRGSMSSGGRGA